MKKEKIFLIAFFIVLTFSGFSQNKINYGIKAGINFSKFLSEDFNSVIISNNQFRTGFQIGITSNYKINKIIWIQTELIYSNQGSKIKYSFDKLNPVTANDPSFKGLPKSVLLNYLCVPFYFKISIIKNITFDSGFQYSFLISSKDVRAYNENSVQIYNDNNSIKKNDFSLNIGVSYKLNPKLYLQFKNNVSLLNIDNGNSLYGRNIKNLNIQFSVEYDLF